MTLRMVKNTVAVSWQAGGQSCWPQTDLLIAGQILDVVPGSPQETAYGANIATLTAAQIQVELTGSDGAATGNV